MSKTRPNSMSEWRSLTLADFGVSPRSWPAPYAGYRPVWLLVFASGRRHGRWSAAGNLVLYCS